MALWLLNSLLCFVRLQQSKHFPTLRPQAEAPLATKPANGDSFGCHDTLRKGYGNPFAAMFAWLLFFFLNLARIREPSFKHGVASCFPCFAFLLLLLFGLVACSSFIADQHLCEQRFQQSTLLKLSKPRCVIFPFLLFKFSILCGCVWLCVAVCGCVWMCVDVCGCVFWI